MFYTIDKDKMYNALQAYITKLAEMGSVPGNVSKAFLYMIFLNDFIDTVQVYLTDKDRSLIDNRLHFLVGNVRCMYPPFTLSTLRGVYTYPSISEE